MLYERYETECLQRRMGVLILILMEYALRAAGEVYGQDENGTES